MLRIIDVVVQVLETLHVMLRGIGGPGREVADCEAYVGTRADTKIGCSHQLGPEESAVGGLRAGTRRGSLQERWEQGLRAFFSSGTS